MLVYLLYNAICANADIKFTQEHIKPIRKHTFPPTSSLTYTVNAIDPRACLCAMDHTRRHETITFAESFEKFKIKGGREERVHDAKVPTP